MQSVHLLSNDIDEAAIYKRKALIYDDKSSTIFTINDNNDNKKNNKEINFSEILFWEAKVEANSSIAAGFNHKLSPSQLISIFMFSADRAFYQAMTYYLCGKSNDDIS